METLDALGLGFAHALAPANLLFTLLGVVVGTFVGVLPGLGSSATIAVLLPLTFNLSPTAAVAMLAGVYYGSQYGGSTTTILLNLPGEAASVATALDGYQLARQGRAGPALGMAAFASFIAGTLGLVFLSLMAKPLADFGLKFGPPEYASLMFLGLLASTNLGEDRLKSVAMCLLGLAVACVGTDVVTGHERFTLGLTELSDGIDFVPATMGLFAVSEILCNIWRPQGQVLRVSTRLRNLLPSAKDWVECKWAILRGSIIGFLVGVLPGAGAAPAAFLAYSVEKQVSPRRDRLGKGAMEGVASPEAANNAATAGAFVPLLSLGIPGSPATAVLAGALMMFGLQPGPFLFSRHGDFVWTLLATMYIGNLLLLVLNLPLIGLWVQALKIPYRILGPIVLVITLVGAYSMRNMVLDVWVVILFGLLGYVARQYGFAPAPMVMGMVLGPMFEQSVRRSLLLSGGSAAVFFVRPISLFLIVLAVLLVMPSPWRLLLNLIRRAMASRSKAS